MKKSILILFACVILYTLASAQQVNQDIVPASPGLKLGHQNQRWDGFIRNLDISGTCLVNGISCVTGNVRHVPFSSLGTSSSGALAYCTDCQQTNPCIAGGTGAWAFGTSLAWNCSLSTGAGGNNLAINGVPLVPTDTANFNNTTPSAPANAINLGVQTSNLGTIDSISFFLQGDGNATHCLNGTGAWSSCGAPAGSNLQFQFNNAGAFGGASGLTYDTTLLMPLMQVFQMNESTATSNPAAGNHWVYMDATSHKITCRNSDASSCMPSGVTLQTNSVNNTSQTTLNVIDSTANAVGLALACTNPAGGNVKCEVSGSSYTGNAATASAVPFGGITAGTNTNTLVIGTGGSLGTSGTGTIGATSLTAASALPNGTTATTQPVGTSGTDVATLDYVISRSATTVGNVFTGDFGVISRGGFITDASVANGGTTITCPNNDCNFISANAGDIVFMYANLTSGTVVIPQTTILTVNTAQSITVASGTAAQACTASCVVIWGPDSSTGLDNAFANAANNCKGLQIQAGVLLTQQPQFNYAGTCPSAALGNYYSPNVYGAGSSATTIVPTPNFNQAAGHGCGTIGTGGCFFGVAFQIVQNLGVKGASYGATGLTNKALTFNNQAIFYYAVFDNWCPACAGTIGYYQAGSQASAIIGGTLNFGEKTCASVTGGANGAQSLINWPCTQSRYGIEVISGNLKSIGGVYSGAASGTGYAIQVDAGAVMDSDNDTIQNGAGPIFVPGTLYLRSLRNTSSAISYISANASTGKVLAEATTFPAATGGTGGEFYLGANGSQFLDRGGNVFNSAAIPVAPSLLQSANKNQAAGASIVLAYPGNLHGTSTYPTTLQVFLRFASGQTLSGCTDTVGNTITQDLTTQAYSTQQAAMLTAHVNTSSAADTVTCTFSGSVTSSDIFITEWNGTASTYDGAVTTTSATGTAVSNGSFTTTNNADVVGFVVMDQGATISTATCTPSSACVVFSTAATNTGIAGIYQSIVPIAGSTTTSGTLNASNVWAGFWFQIRPYAAYPGIYQSDSITGTLQTAANWSTPAGAGAGQWGTSPSVGSCSGTSNRQVCTITVGSGTVGANPVLTVTQPTTYLSPPMCDAQMIGGTATFSNFTTGTVSTTTAAFTYNGTPSASSTITVKVSCSN